MKSNLETTEVKAKTIQPRLATLLLVIITLVAALIAILWAAGLGQIEDIFAYLDLLQKQPPMWVEAPMVMSRYLLIPTILLFLPILIITKVNQ